MHLSAKPFFQKEGQEKRAQAVLSAEHKMIEDLLRHISDEYARPILKLERFMEMWSSLERVIIGE